MPLFGPLAAGALFARRALGLDDFLLADRDFAPRAFGQPSLGFRAAATGYPRNLRGIRPGDFTGDFGGAGNFGGGEGFDAPMFGLPLGSGVGAGAGASGLPLGFAPNGAPVTFPLLGPQTTRRTQLFGPLANLSAPRL